MIKFLIVLGKIFAAIIASLSVIFVIQLKQLQMLPTDLIFVIGFVLAFLIGLFLWLTWNGSGVVRMSIGSTMAVVMLVALSVGNLFIHKTIATLDKISAGDTEIVHVGIYVRSDDTNDYSAEASGYCHGILKELDRESTDRALQQIAQKLGVAPKYQEYQRLPELIDALLAGQIDAIVINAAYLDLLQEMAGYEDILTKIRETELKKVEVEIQKPTLPPDTQPAETLPDEPQTSIPAFCVYISGVDDEGATIARTRSDTNILAVVNLATRQLLLISTPRDYYVPLSISNGIPDKLTHAGIYGVNVSMQTLEMLYDTSIDYYFRLNFTGFIRVIDALGGISVYSTRTFDTLQIKGYHFEKGYNEMDGRTALAFSRERYAFKDGDHQRGRNQMAVIQGVVRKLVSPALLTNYLDVLSSVEGCFETSVPMEIVGRIVSQQLRNGGEWNVTTYSVSGKNDFQIPYSMSQKVYVMQPDYKTVEHAKELINKVYNGEVPEP